MRQRATISTHKLQQCANQNLAGGNHQLAPDMDHATIAIDLVGSAQTVQADAVTVSNIPERFTPLNDVP